MSEQVNHPSRRDVIKWFAGVPFLPLGAMATASVLSGCGNNNDSGTSNGNSNTGTNTGNNPFVRVANFASATFTPMAAPNLSNPAAMATTSVNSMLNITWDDKTTTNYKLGYQRFFNTGEMVDGLSGTKVLAGGYYDVNNKPIMDTSVAGNSRQFFSDCPDGSSLIKIDGAKVAGVANPVFHVVQFEYVTRNLKGDSMYGALPSPIAILTLDQDPTTGHLALKKYHNVDTSGVYGLWITCGASMSPWNTHLSSEEYEPDAFNQGIGGPSTDGMGQYFFGDKTKANPYNYGHLPEVIVNTDGSGTVKKHYCLGRISHELIQMMPDNRTALMGDDYTNGGLFMFVADKEKDLSAGTLYVAKYIDELNEKSTARIQWIKLGWATSQEIRDLVNVKNIKPTDIMDSVTTDPNDSSFTKIVLNKKTLWVRVKPGMEKAAAFLETHRYAAMMGGSLAFTKMEGTTVNVKDKVAYSAISAIRDSMVKGASGYVAANNVTFQKAIQAGGILAHDMKNAQVDSKGMSISSDWVPYQSRFVLFGEDLAAADALGNTAHADKIANPDNLKFSEELRTLFIGEDSGMHVNNFLWAYNVDTKALDRILSAPAGAESTGLHAVDNLNGWTYIMSNFQHPGDWESIHSVVQPTLDPLVRANYNNRYAASVGYITADPIAPSTTKK